MTGTLSCSASFCSHSHAGALSTSPAQKSRSRLLRSCLRAGAEPFRMRRRAAVGEEWLRARAEARSEEHTSELQSPYDLVCRLLLEKKKNIGKTKSIKITIV